MREERKKPPVAICVRGLVLHRLGAVACLDQCLLQAIFVSEGEIHRIVIDHDCATFGEGAL